LDDLSFGSIDEAGACWLERDFEEIEVLEVVKAMNGEKASSPDNYSLLFFQACRVVLKEDIMKVLHDFHARCKFVRRLIATVIALISKIVGAVDPKKFCMISLVSGIYKIIAKILANMLKMILTLRCSCYSKKLSILSLQFSNFFKLLLDVDASGDHVSPIGVVL
jgi:hypothetical protein